MGGYGFWRGFVDEQVRRYLDCGLFENGFARVWCPGCRAEYLLAFSCKTRELCPSCATKRGAATAVLLREEVLEEVGHSQWVFVMPKMLRLYFLHHRVVLGKLARAAWQTVLDLMVEATGEETLRPGMVAVVQTAGDLARWHPHVHALVSRGGWTRCWEWVPVAYVDEHAAELIFRHKVMSLLQEEGRGSPVSASVTSHLHDSQEKISVQHPQSQTRYPVFRPDHTSRTCVSLRSNEWKFLSLRTDSTSAGSRCRAEADGAVAMVDVETSWCNGECADFLGNGPACTIYLRCGGEWKLIAHTGLLEYAEE